MNGLPVAPDSVDFSLLPEQNSKPEPSSDLPAVSVTLPVLDEDVPLDIPRPATQSNAAASSGWTALPEDGNAQWRNVSPFQIELEHSQGCDCGNCYMPEETAEDATDSSGTVSGTTTASAPSILGDLSDYLVSGYWTRNGSSVPERFHNVSSTGIDPNDGVLLYNVSGYSEDANGLSAERAFLVREAFKVFEATLGIQFVETTSTNTSTVDFFFRDNASGAYASTGYYSNGEQTYSRINIAESWSGSTSSYDDYTLQTIFHEIGHALGLGHQGGYNGSASYGTDNDFENDSWQASMMSYFSQTQNTSINASYEYLQTPMSVDWMALNDLYGRQGYGTSNAFTENTTWGFNTTITSAVSDIWAQFSNYAHRTASTIVDSGGIDTLDLSGYANNTLINLAPSDRGSTAPSLSNIGGRIGNLSIAEGTIIENAVGGAGSETFYGNVADNTLTGNGGDDTFFDSAGSDTYLGGAGSDTVNFGMAFADFTYTVSGTFLQVINVAIDLVEITVEWLGFTDGTRSWSDVANSTSPNTAPLANNDSAAVSEDGTVSGNVLSNDTDADNNTLSVISVNGQGGAVGSQITLASGAQVTLNANGTFTYDTNGAFEALNTGQSAQDGFTYTVSDGQGGSASANVAVTVNGVTDVVNGGPSAVNDSATVAEDAVLSGLAVLANDSDPDSDPIAITRIAGTNVTAGGFVTLASGARVTLNANGTLTYDQRGAFDSLNTGQTANESFNYTISDGQGGTSTATVNVTVQGVTDNVVPVARNDTGSVAEDALLTGNVLANDTDANGDTLSVVAVNGQTSGVGTAVNLASGARVTLNANGTYSYDPNGAFNALTTGQTANDSFTYRVSDGQGGTSTATVNVTVQGVSEPVTATPVLVDFESTPLGAFAGVEDVDASGLDVRLGTVLSGTRYAETTGFTLTSTGEGFDMDAATLRSAGGRVQLFIESYDGGVLMGSRTVNLRSNKTVEISLGTAFDNIDELRVTATGKAYVDNLALVTHSLTEPGGNLDPIAENDVLTTSETQTVTSNLLANDSDPDNGTPALVSVGGETDGSVTLQSGAVVTYSANGSITYDPNGAYDALYDGQTAQDSFVYEISDGQGGTAQATAVVNINGSGTAPTGPTTYHVGFEAGANETLLVEDGFQFRDVITTARNIGVAEGSLAVQSSGDSITMERVDGFDFDLESAVFSALSGRNVRMVVEAFDDGVMIASETFRLRDNRETTIDFSDALFDNVNQVVFSASGGLTVDDMLMIV